MKNSQILSNHLILSDRFRSLKLLEEDREPLVAQEGTNP